MGSERGPWLGQKSESLALDSQKKDEAACHEALGIHWPVGGRGPTPGLSKVCPVPKAVSFLFQFKCWHYRDCPLLPTLPELCSSEYQECPKLGGGESSPWPSVQTPIGLNTSLEAHPRSRCAEWMREPAHRGQRPWKPATWGSSSDPLLGANPFRHFVSQFGKHSHN